MATFNGNLIDGPEAVLVYGNPDYGSRPLTVDYTEGYESGLADIGTVASGLPIEEVANTWDGNLIGEYGYLDFYFRIHIEFDVLSLGAVVNDVTTPFWVFNAWLTQRTLNDVDLATTDPGLELVSPHGAPPVTYEPLEVKTYNLEVDNQGSATIAGTVTLTFDTQTLDMEITGIRVLSWRWSPNWSEGVRERLDWLSDVERSYSGKELRRQLRTWPTQTMEFVFDIGDQQMRVMENMLYTWGARLWAVPFWPDVQSLTDTLPIGSDTLTIDTTSRTFTEAELLILVSDVDDEYQEEVLTISGVSDGEVELLQPTSIEWPAGTLVYPGRLMRLQDGANLMRFVRSHSYGTAVFRSANGLQYEALTETLYRGYPVLLVEPTQKPDPSTGYVRQWEMIDFQTGLSDVDDQALLPDQLAAHHRILTNRDEIDEFRKYLYARAGRTHGIWVPTFVQDLILAENVTAAANNMVFEYAGLKHFAEGGVHRRDIRIELTNGTVLYRRVSSPETVIDGETERMDINVPLGVAITPADVKLISWMALSRLDSDSIELSWAAPHVVEALTVYRSYKNDV